MNADCGGQLESMIGSYGPSDAWLTKRFDSDEAPSGMLVRTGTCACPAAALSHRSPPS